jgi:hypothetical protein
MDIHILGYELNLEIIILCVVLYCIIVFNLIYSAIRFDGLKEIYELLGISIEEGFEILKQTTQNLKQLKQKKLQQKNKPPAKQFSNST